MSDPQDILRAIGRLEGKVDIMLATITTNQQANIDRMNRIDQDIENVREDLGVEIARMQEQVSGLDKKQYAIIIIAVVIWTFVTEWLKGLFFK